MQADPGGPDPARGQCGDQLGRERPAGARHLGAARRCRVDVLVGIQRPPPVDVAVADRLAEAPQELGHGLAASERNRATHSRSLPAYGATSSRRTVRSRPRTIVPAARRAAPGVEPSAPRSSTTHQRSSSCGTGVEKFTRTGSSPHVPARRPATEAGSVAETLTTSRSWRSSSCGSSWKRALTSAPALAFGDHQPDTVAPETALLGRLGRLERVGSSKASALTRTPPRSRRGRGPELTCRVATAGARHRRSAPAARARCPPAAADPRCPRQGTPPGASACACRRDRPRTRAAAAARRRGSRVSWSSAAFEAP